ncbi:eukaryotic translation initiation factor 2-alpha kinase-like [Tubulanus polymorphus]|uniref:eukaryotic translation initiation factor 2-alpha kinase-like n=1 Tax=Tubulanus polymorphus TaxID=672921 RepID=UPI003DA3BEEB
MGNLWIKLLSLTIFILFTCCSLNICANGQILKGTNSPTTTTTATPRPSCSNRFLLLVSTLDGKVSALNLAQKGSVEWSIDTGVNPLLSASISNLEINKDGVSIRLIPALDGGLYQFDGDSVEAMPFTAESLLSSSQRLTEESMVVGGKDSMTYGIDVKSGEVKYVCHMSGCQKFADEAVKDGEDLIIIRRNTQTVRAVEIRSGNENWNFSVGHHDVTYLHGQKHDEKDSLNCSEGSDDDVMENENLKVFIPNGLVVVVDKNNPSNVIWKHKFDKPIAKAWTLKNGILEEVSMFDYRHVSALAERNIKTGAIEELPSQPLLYLGSYDNQMYVQPSKKMTDEINKVVEKYARGSNTELIPMPKVEWRPYLASAPSRTPLVIVSKRKLIGSTDFTSMSKGALIKRNDVEYPFDNGYYLFADKKPVVPTLEEEETDSTDDISFVTVINVSFWYWWREVVAVSVTTSILVHIFISRYLNRGIAIIATKVCDDDSGKAESSQSHGNNTNNSDEAVVEQPVKSASSPDLMSANDFTSRYYSDFEPIRCLGAGGFGVVFEAKNKIDECHYAIKRICVRNSEKAKEKVMREARALAKLDHVGIVRYHQVWIETPPPGWQEERDREIISDSSACNSLFTGSPATPVESMGSSIFKPKHAQSEPLLNELKFSKPFENIRKESPRNNVKRDDFLNEGSGSFSTGMNSAFNKKLDSFRKQTDDSSFEVVFKNSDSESSMNHGDSSFDHVPFRRYQNQKRKEVADGIIEEESNLFYICDDSGFAVKSSNSAENQPESDYSESDTSSLKAVVIGNQSNVEWSESESKIDSYSAQRPSTLFLDRENKPETTTTPISPISDQPRKLYLYIQMQLCRPESLKDWLNNNTLNRNRNELLDIFIQIVGAVEYVHDCGLMHRDLKPSNIFFSMDGIVKIGDFGLVTDMDEAPELAQFEIRHQNQSQQFTRKHTDQVGTQLYMSPEQIAGQAYDYKVDIFSLGLIFLELMHPFSTQMERVMILTQARQQKYSERFQRELPEECKFVNWLLSNDPEMRPDTREIQSSDMLVNVERIRPARSRTQTRTISTSSSNGST